MLGSLALVNVKESNQGKMTTTTLTRPERFLIALGLVTLLTVPSAGQQPPDQSVKLGYVIDVPVPLESGDANRLIGQLSQLNESSPENQRVTVVLRYQDPSGTAGAETQFEDALKVARAITGQSLRRVRVVSLVESAINGHSVLPIIASDMVLVSADGALANASAGDSTADETIELNYRTIAEKRGLFPPAVVSALVDPAQELALVSKVGGDQVFAAGAELKELRATGKVLGEEVWSASGVPLTIDSKQLRTVRAAAGVVDSLDAAAELLDLAKLNPLEGRLTSGAANGVLLDITGSIVGNRVRRWQSNLSSTLDSGEVNTWVIQIDSSGGSLDDSATLGGWFANPEPPLRVVAGLIRGEARGDAALVAVSCKPCYMTPSATIGGPGADSFSPADLARYDELIDQIALSTKRSAALIRGLLNPEIVVYRYTHRKTGRIRYATEDDIVSGVEDAAAEQAKWQRGERIELDQGLTTAEAVALGLVDGESPSLEDTSRRVGLSSTPEEVADRGLVRFVENLGRSQSLAFLLIFIGFTALSAEANAPVWAFQVSWHWFASLFGFGSSFWQAQLNGLNWSCLVWASFALEWKYLSFQGSACSESADWR